MIPRVTRAWMRWHADSETIGDRVVILVCVAAVLLFAVEVIR